MAGVVAGRQERKSARGNRFAFCQLSDPTGAFEVTLFSETLEKSREHLETGAKVLLTVEATMEADQLKLLGRGVSPVDQGLAGAVSGLRIFLDDADVLPRIAGVLTRAADQMPKAARGPVELLLPDYVGLPGDTVLRLPQEFPVTPEIRGAVKSLAGVLAVEEV
jgi:DNA polymerase-3 subunit alpha